MKHKGPHMRKISKVEITVKTQGQSQNLRYQLKSLITRKTHMKYKSHITYHSKDMVNVKVEVSQISRSGGQTLLYQ
jgi:hypothetical protein